MNTITNQIKLIGGMLSFMIAAVVLITVYINETSQRDSVVINVAGKQRMLTQRITKDVLWLQNGKSVEFGEIDASTAEFEATLGDLIHGNAERNIYAPPKSCIKERLLQVEGLWLRFRENLERFKGLISDTKRLRSGLQAENTTILEVSDAVVKEMVALGLEGRYIDDSGRQRMLTQKMALHSTQYLLTGELKHFSEFYDAYGLYESTLQGFLGDAALKRDATLQELLEANRVAWRHYSEYVRTLMEKQKEINDAVAYIKDNNMVLMDTMDSAVTAYTEHSKTQRRFLQYFQYAASIIALLAMFYSARLTWKIERHFEEFLKHSEAMASSVAPEEGTLPEAGVRGDELTMASMHMNHFAAKITAVLEHARQAIHASEQAARELADVSETMDEELEGLGLDEASKRDIDKTIDKSEDIAIQTLEELSGTSRLLEQLQRNLDTIISKTEKRG